MSESIGACGVLRQARPLLLEHLDRIRFCYTRAENSGPVLAAPTSRFTPTEDRFRSNSGKDCQNRGEFLVEFSKACSGY